jgi:hypothetical protein
MAAQFRARMVGWMTLVLFAGCVWYGVWSISPPGPVPETAPEHAFSSGRAMRHLSVIAAEPHPLQSAANAKVREYLVAELRRQGFEVEVQETLYTPPSGPSRPPRPPVALANIIARLKGEGTRPAVAVACHYDSVPLAPGAGDDGAAVAAMIETARAIRSGIALRNDLVILITDGEEAGLLGAREFMKQSPLAKRIGVVFNYDGRGCGGPSILMETSRGNGRLIREFARAAPYPLGASLANVVYQTLPNSTDMTVFNEYNLAGLNFCIDKGLAFYHQPTDTIQNLDEATVQQIGANALALARHFGNLDLADVRGEDEIFFNPWGMIFVHYPISWNRPLAILVIAAASAGIVILIKQKELQVRGLLAGIGASLVIAFCAVAPVLGLSAWIFRWPHFQAAMVNGDLPNGASFLAGFSALALAGGTGCTALFRRQLTLASLAAGGMTIWIVLAGVACTILPAACYQFVWPLAWGSLGSFAALLLNDQPTTSVRRAMIGTGLCWLATAAVVVQFAPIIYLVGITFGTAKIWMAAVPLAFVGLLLVPCWELTSRAHGWLVPVLCTIVAVLVLTAAGAA